MAFIPRDENGFTQKERKLVEAFLETGNGAEAVRRAGFALGSQGGSQTKLQAQKTASQIAREYLDKPHIKSYISKMMLQRKISPERILDRINYLADKADRDSDKLRALELLGKHKRLFTDDKGTDKPVNIVLKLGTFQGKKITEAEVVKPEVIDQPTDKIDAPKE